MADHEGSLMQVRGARDGSGFTPQHSVNEAVEGDVAKAEKQEALHQTTIEI